MGLGQVMDIEHALILIQVGEAPYDLLDVTSWRRGVGMRGAPPLWTKLYMMRNLTKPAPGKPSLAAWSSGSTPTLYVSFWLSDTKPGSLARV